MKTFKQALLLTALAMASASTQAQSTVNEERCRQLQNDVNQAFSSAVSSRVPSQSPSKAVEEAVDIKSLLSFDTSAGFSKLISTGFNKLVDSLIQKGMDAVNKKANQTFNNNINNILQKNGIAPIMKNPDLSGVVGQVGQAAKATIRPASTTSTANPYDRP